MPDQTEPSPQPSLKVNLFDLETLAKGVALIAGVGLGVAFLFDMVFFTVLDPRLKRLLVMSDHIESAIATLPALLLVVLLYGALPVLLFRFKGARTFGLGMATAAIGAAILGLVGLSSVEVSDRIPSLVMIAPAIFLLVRHAFLPPEKRSKLPFGLSPNLLFVYGIVIVLFVTTAMAFFAAKATLKDIASKPKFMDLVWLTDLSSVHGLIVRVIDRGVILAVPGSETEFTFVPKEQVRRLEFKDPRP